jgi:hypothetical protein
VRVQPVPSGPHAPGGTGNRRVGGAA